MLWITLVWIALIILAVYLAIPGGRLYRKYLADIKTSLDSLNIRREGQDIFTEEKLAALPGLLRKHITNGGYLNRPVMENMLMRYRHTKFRMSPGGKLMKIGFMQVNFARRPDRHAFLTGKIAGIPIQAKDSLLDGHGSMTGMLAKQFRLFHSTGPLMDQGQLITALADAVYMPSLFLQSFVAWKTRDAHSVEGAVSWRGIPAKGVFTFDDKGNIIQFDTADRYLDENGKGGALGPWRVVYSNYQKRNGYFQPGGVAVSWRLPDGDDIYFVSDQIEISYSIQAEDL